MFFVIANLLIETLHNFIPCKSRECKLLISLEWVFGCGVNSAVMQWSLICKRNLKAVVPRQGIGASAIQPWKDRRRLV